MPKHIREAVVRLIERRAKTLKHLSINWFGGEPLLARRQIVATASELQNIAEQNGFVRNDFITTNGYLLTTECADELIEKNISTFQITLDGPELYHNQTRVRRSGAPTFDKIYNNLLSMKSINKDFRVAIRVHVHDQNFNIISNFIMALDKDFGADMRFGLHLVPVESYATGASASFKSTHNRSEFDVSLKTWALLAPNLKLLNVPSGSCLICYASKMNSFAIRSDGLLMKCTVAVDDPRNILGRLREDGSLEIDKEKLLWWAGGFKTGNLNQLACPNS